MHSTNRFFIISYTINNSISTIFISFFIKIVINIRNT
nr:MAG TPA: hypothetical protein [Caudoviricetes sp.]